MFGNGANTQVVWKIVNHFQNLMILIWTQVLIPHKYAEALTGFQVMLFDFRPLIPFLDEYFKILSDWFNTNNTVLEKFNDTGFNYFSVLVNYQATFIFAIVGFFFHLVFTFIYNHTDKRMFKWREKLIVKFYEQMTFGFYIRIILELSLFLILNSVLETMSITNQIKDHNLFKTSSISKGLSILWIIFYITFIYWQFKHLLTVKMKKNNIREKREESIRVNEMNKIKHRNHDKYSILYEGLKETHNKRKSFCLIQSFQLIFIIRRVLMVAIIVSFVSCNSKNWSYAQIGTLLTLQLVFMSYILLIHAFTETENNIIEIFNEFIFTFLIIIWGTLPHSREIGDNLFIKYSLKERIMESIVIFSSMAVALISHIP